ncbi:hypothetical protein GFS24_09360 [Chitinophaga sp. SYP-B3965]|uniref:hypothetical protein n=1 Tax=Chitinophaga sp. SYP-B3965 TaxID=2663120 RepID=UPI0012998C3A|nr:hypothetical protein [Chitinophaga sp. SYP-B3965]MRG45323.1 hypothetical protein [Chitinophaga sp. SYP-B3965]
MEKILYITDAVKLDIQNLDFACFLCNLTHSKLTGVFLKNEVTEVRTPEKLRETAIASAIPGASVGEVKASYCVDNISLFKNACEIRGVNYGVHEDVGMPLNEVIAESRYADLMIVDVATSFIRKREMAPSSFIKDLFAEAECPVVIAPYTFDGIDKIIFTFDGSASSVYAIKQFTYLFPELSDRKACILNVTSPGKNATANDHKLNEWLQAHYSDTDIVVLEDQHIKMRLVEYLLEQKKTFVVMGAFGRSMVSNFLSPSHAGPVIDLMAQPVFITHR